MAGIEQKLENFSEKFEEKDLEGIKDLLTFFRSLQNSTKEIGKVNFDDDKNTSLEEKIKGIDSHDSELSDTEKELFLAIKELSDKEEQVSFLNNLVGEIEGNKGEESSSWFSFLELSNYNIISNLKESKGNIGNKYLQKYMEESISRLKSGSKVTKFDELLNTIANKGHIRRLHNIKQDKLIGEILNNGKKEYNEHYIKGHSSELSNYLLKIEDFEDYLRKPDTVISGKDESASNVVNSKALANYLLYCKDFGKKPTGVLSNEQIKELLSVWEEKAKKAKKGGKVGTAYKILKEKAPSILSKISFSSIAYEMGIDDFENENDFIPKVVELVKKYPNKLYAVTDSELFLKLLDKNSLELSTHLDHINSKVLNEGVINELCKSPYLNAIDLVLKIPEAYWEENSLPDNMITLINNHNKKDYIYRLLQNRGVGDSKLAGIVLGDLQNEKPDSHINNGASINLGSQNNFVSGLEAFNSSDIIGNFKNLESSYSQKSSVDYSKYMDLYKNDDSFKNAIIEALKSNPDDIIYLNFIFNNAEISKEIIQQLPNTFKHFPKNVRENFDVALSVLQIAGEKPDLQYLLEYIPLSTAFVKQNIDKLNSIVKIILGLYGDTNSIRYRDFLFKIRDIISKTNFSDEMKNILRMIDEKKYINEIKKFEKVGNKEGGKLDSEAMLQRLEKLQLTDTDKKAISKFLGGEYNKEDLLKLANTFSGREHVFKKVVDIIVAELEKSQKQAKEEVLKKASKEDWEKLEKLFGVELPESGNDGVGNSDEIFRKIYEVTYSENKYNSPEEIRKAVMAKINGSDISEDSKKRFLDYFASVKAVQSTKVLQKAIAKNPSGPITIESLEEAEVEQNKEWIKQNFSEDIAEKMITNIEKKFETSHDSEHETYENHTFNNTIYNYNPEAGTLNSNGQTVKLSEQDEQVIQNNPEAMENLVNFSEVLQKVGLTKLWGIKEQIFTAIGNVKGQGFKLDGDYLNESEIMKFLNSIIVSVGEKEQTEATGLDDMVAKIQVLNKIQAFGGMKTENNLYGTTNIEEKFINNFIPRGNMVGFLAGNFTNAISGKSVYKN